MSLCDFDLSPDAAAERQAIVEFIVGLHHHYGQQRRLCSVEGADSFYRFGQSALREALFAIRVGRHRDAASLPSSEGDAQSNRNL